MAAMANDDKTASNASPMNIATISAGFEKGDFLVREEQGNRVYFDFFEEVWSLFTAKHRSYRIRSATTNIAANPRHFYFFSHTLTLFLEFAFSLGFQLHFQQGLFSYVQRRRKALG
jgi:hypothetical protein